MDLFLEYICNLCPFRCWDWVYSWRTNEKQVKKEACSGQRVDNIYKARVRGEHKHFGELPVVSKMTGWEAQNWCFIHIEWMNEWERREKGKETGYAGRRQIVQSSVNLEKSLDCFLRAMWSHDRVWHREVSLDLCFWEIAIVLCSKAMTRSACCNSPGERWWWLGHTSRSQDRDKRKEEIFK